MDRRKFLLSSLALATGGGLILPSRKAACTLPPFTDYQHELEEMTWAEFSSVDARTKNILTATIYVAKGDLKFRGEPWPGNYFGARASVGIRDPIRGLAWRYDGSVFWDCNGKGKSDTIDFKREGFSSATLQGVIPVYPVYFGGTFIDLAVDLTWTGTEQKIQDVENAVYKDEWLQTELHYRGKSCLATASGIVTLDGDTNLTPEPSTDAYISLVATGCIEPPGKKY